MLGGAYLCYEGAEKVLHALRPHAACIFNRVHDATGRNPGTGTTSPDVVREIRP